MNMSLGYTPQRTKLLLSWIGTGKKILDLGCYDGRDSVLFKKQGNEVYGVDKTKSALAKAKKLGIKTYHLDIEKQPWPFKKEFFDVMIAGEIIEHLVDTDRFLKNIYRILKSNGVLILTTPNLASLGRRLLLLLGKNPYIEVSKHKEVNGFPPVGHVRYFVKETLQKLLAYHGFVIEELTSDNLYFGLGWSQIIPKYIPSLGWRFIVRARKK